MEEIHTTETSENSTLLPVISTETTENLDQSTQPLVADRQTGDTSDQSAPTLFTNQTNEALEQSTPPQVTNTESTETLTQSAMPQVTNTQATENLEHSVLNVVTKTEATECLNQSTPAPVTNTRSETLEQSTLPLLTNAKSTETLEHSVLLSGVADNSHVNVVPSSENHQGMEMRQETAEEKVEIKSILKVIAATGKFWHDWEKLRNMLSIHLKQVISEYPQAKMTIEEQKMSLGETHAELVKRLDDALHSFVDGPPFTLQRLSEIILDAQSLYPNLSKLALALEKNLSVTSTLTISTDPYPPATITTNGLDKVNVDPNPDPNPNSNPNPNPNPIPNPDPNLQLQPDTVFENGAPPVETDRDEVMTEVEADVSDVTTMDMETYQKSSEVSSSMRTGNS